MNEIIRILLIIGIILGLVSIIFITSCASVQKSTEWKSMVKEDDLSEGEWKIWVDRRNCLQMQ